MAYPTKRDTIAVVLTQNIDLNVDGGGLLVQLTGDGFTGTVDFQATVDGVTYYNIPYQNRASLTAGTSVSQITNPSTATLYFIPGPLGQVRIAVTRSVGTLTVVYRTVGPEQLIIANGTGVLVDTELAAAVAAADALTNPTVPQVITHPEGYAPDGAWDRLRTAGNAVPNLGRLKVLEYRGAPTLLVSDTTANDSDKTITPTAGKQWHILSVYASLVTTASVGARHMTLRVLSNGTMVTFFRALPTQAASLTRHYIWAPGLPREAAFNTTDTSEGDVLIPLPNNFWIDDTFTIRIFDDQALDPTYDDLTVYIVGHEHDD